MRAILAGHGEDGPPTPGRPDVVGPYLHHLIDHHRVLVTVEGPDVIAFGAVVDTGRCTMLSDLFVRSDRLGRGHGGSLLGELFGAARRRATFASSDPRALPLYVRAGMTPRWVNLYLEGPAAALPATPPTLVARDAIGTECADLEQAWTGADRRTDHEFLARLPGADAFVVGEGGSPVAFGHSTLKSPGARALERLIVRPGLDPVAPIVAGLRRAARGGRIEGCVPGPNPVLPVLLEAGFRIVDQDQFLATDGDIADPARLLPNGGLL
jgi:GNAT superfamily N-acetyltransferase